MSKDVKGYYARLGVTPTASEAEIKAAYRALAKKHHPDTGGHADAGARFKAISEAYKVLGDADSRAEYDGLSATTTATAQEQSGSNIEPISCSQCGQVTAQPRYVVFRHVVSFLLATVRTPTQGIFCAQCARKKALKATAISSTVGWWGVPWGPVWTVVESLKNAFGGTSVPAASEKLIWHNALAFGMRGDSRLSLALADKLRGSKDREIAAQAAKLIEHFRSRGIELGSSVLKDPWIQPAQHIALNLLMLAALPAALAGFIYIGAREQAPKEASTTFSSPEYPVSDQANFSPPSLDQLERIAPTPIVVKSKCNNIPENGKVLTGRGILQAKGHILDINNGSAGDAIVKLRDAVSLKSKASFFVKSNETASLKGIPDGTYKIQYAFGPSLNETCKSFSDIESAGQFPESETFITEKTETDLGTRVQWSHLTYTLYSVPGGNVRPDTIDANSFDQ